MTSDVRLLSSGFIERPRRPEEPRSRSPERTYVPLPEKLGTLTASRAQKEGKGTRASDNVDQRDPDAASSPTVGSGLHVTAGGSTASTIQNTVSVLRAARLELADPKDPEPLQL